MVETLTVVIVIVACIPVPWGQTGDLLVEAIRAPDLV